jgi:hypothetical protein
VVAKVIAGAAVVNVLSLTTLRLFGLRLTGDGASAVTTFDQFAAVCHLVRAVNFLAEEVLHTVPRSSVYKRLVRAGMPLALVFDLADVKAVGQDVVKLARPVSGFDGL